jgi:hypothetical protein
LQAFRKALHDAFIKYVWCLDLKQAIHTFGFQKHIKKQVLALAESRLHPHQFAACAKAKCPKSRFKASENKTKQNKTKQAIFAANAKTNDY